MFKARLLREQGLKQKDIADQVGVSTRMVRKYLKPDYQPKTRVPRPSLLDPYKLYIQSLLEEKPFFNLVCLAATLRERGYRGGMSILREYAAGIRKHVLTKAVVRFESEPGRQAQVDWKECGRWMVDGELKKVFAFVMLLGYSRKPFVLFTTSMSSPVFLAAHSKAFAFYGGVPREVLYDNMKTAWVAEGGEWKVQKGLRDYAVQVGFEPKRCQVRRPQTKGKVERFIGYLGNHFLPMARQKGLQSIGELNDSIGAWLESVDHEVLRDFCESRSERFDMEKPHLKPWIPEADPKPRLSLELMVSREGLVSYQTNRYSLPAEYIGCLVRLEVNPLGYDAAIFWGGKEIRKLQLQPPGARMILREPADETSLWARWQCENRPSSKPVIPPAALEPRASVPTIEVDVRAASFYDRFEGRSI